MLTRRGGGVGGLGGGGGDFIKEWLSLVSSKAETVSASFFHRLACGISRQLAGELFLMFSISLDREKGNCLKHGTCLHVPGFIYLFIWGFTSLFNTVQVIS